jgi:dihydrofolate synthase/folylpolyglutamate synthase
MICDIGHNEHGLKYNFAQLKGMMESGECTDVIIVYGSVADKDLDAVLPLLPMNARYVFTQADSKRALPAEVIRQRFDGFCTESGRRPVDVYCCSDVAMAVTKAKGLALEILDSDPSAKPLVYIGGSTYVVSEAVTLFQ